LKRTKLALDDAVRAREDAETREAAARLTFAYASDRVLEAKLHEARARLAFRGVLDD
jgi:hypothetical protein